MSHHHSSRRHELNKLTSLPMCGFIAQLVEQRTGNAEVMGSNPVEALFFFFRLLLSNCLNWKIYCDDHSLLSATIIDNSLSMGTRDDAKKLYDSCFRFMWSRDQALWDNRHILHQLASDASKLSQ